MPKDPREYRLQKLFGISVAEYEMVLGFQGNVCAICGVPPTPARRLSNDHRHKDGAHRGLLCFGCNSRLSERITPEWLRKAADYLEDPPTHRALGRVPIGVIGRITTRRKRRKRK